MRISTVIVAFLLSAVPAAASVQTPFELLDDGSLIVPVTIGGTGVYRFVLDTGSSRTVISTRLSQALRLPIIATTQMVTPAGRTSASIARVDRLAIGDQPAVNVSAAVIQGDRYAAGQQVDGLIGQDALAGSIYTIDYKARVITWHSADEHLQGTRVPLTVVDNRVLVKLAQFEGDASPLTLVPDSGSDGLVLFARAQPKVRMTLLDIGVLSSVTGTRLARRARIDSLVVGNARLVEPLAAIVDDDDPEGLMGDGLLPLHAFARVTFNLAEQYLIVRAN